MTHLARTFLSRHSQLSQGQEARRWPACFKHVTHHEPNKEKLSQEFKPCFGLISYFSFSPIPNVFPVVVIMIFTTTINVVVTSSHLLLPMGKILVTERRVLLADSLISRGWTSFCVVWPRFGLKILKIRPKTNLKICVKGRSAPWQCFSTMQCL